MDGSGREWLTQSSAVGTIDPDNFLSGEVSGWDECAPSIDRCTVDGVAVRDHGELWSMPFDRVGEGGVRARMTGFDWTFERQIASHPRGLRMTYTATAHSVALPLLWAAHPQFAAPPGTRVVLPASVTQVIELTEPEPVTVPWHSLSIDDLAPATSRKFYVDPDSPVSWAAIERPDGSRLTLSWPSHVPYLGVWFDAGEFAASNAIAIEPTTGFYDSAARARATDRIAVVTDQFDWWITLTLS